MSVQRQGLREGTERPYAPIGVLLVLQLTFGGAGCHRGAEHGRARAERSMPRAFPVAEDRSGVYGFSATRDGEVVSAWKVDGPTGVVRWRTGAFACPWGWTYGVAPRSLYVGGEELLRIDAQTGDVCALRRLRALVGFYPSGETMCVAQLHSAAGRTSGEVTGATVSAYEAATARYLSRLEVRGGPVSVLPADAERVYVSYYSDDGTETVLGWETATGRRWERSLPGKRWIYHVVPEGLACSDGRGLMLLDATSGRTRWETGDLVEWAGLADPSVRIVSIRVVGQYVVARLEGWRFIGVSLASGQVLWQSDLPELTVDKLVDFHADGLARPEGPLLVLSDDRSQAADMGGTYRQSDSVVIAVDPATGRVRWIRPLRLVQREPAPVGGRSAQTELVYALEVAASGDRTLVAIDPVTDRIAWKARVRCRPLQVRVGDGCVFLSDEPSTGKGMATRCLDNADGRELWRVENLPELLGRAGSGAQPAQSE